MRTAIAAVALAAVAVAAGCGGTATPTPGGMDSPTEPTATTTPGELSYPAGVSDAGVTDPDALLSAHRAALSGQSLTVAISYRVSTNGTGQVVSFTGEVDPAANRTLLHVSLRDGTVDYYVSGDGAYARQQVGGTTQYQANADVPTSGAERLGSDRFVEAALQSGNFTPDGVVTRDGRRLHRFTVTGVTTEQFDAGGRNATRTIDGELLVSERGVVRSVTVNATVETADGGRYVYGVSVEVTDVGSTTVERPDWVDEAEAAG